MVTIRAIEQASHFDTWEDGRAIALLIEAAFRKNETVRLSLAGVDGLPTSFVNGAFISLLDEFDFDFIRDHLTIVDSNKSINDMIKRRFQFERNRRATAV